MARLFQIYSHRQAASGAYCTRYFCGQEAGCEGGGWQNREADTKQCVCSLKSYKHTELTQSCLVFKIGPKKPLCY